MKTYFLTKLSTFTENAVASFVCLTNVQIPTVRNRAEVMDPVRNPGEKVSTRDQVRKITMTSDIDTALPSWETESLEKRRF